MIRIRFSDELEASIEAGRWHCEDAKRERLLNAMLSPWEDDSVKAEEHDMMQAEIAARILGAEISSASKTN